MWPPSGPRITPLMSSVSFDKGNLSVKLQLLTQDSHPDRRWREAVKKREALPPSRAPAVGDPGGQHLGRAHGAFAAPPAAAPAGRKAPRPGRRLAQMKGLFCLGCASLLPPFASAVPERRVRRPGVRACGEERSCSSLCSPALVKLMSVSAQSGYCKPFRKCICLIEHLPRVWSKVKSGGVFRAPCRCCLSCKISELL